MRGSRKKECKNLHVFILSQKGQFWTVFGQNGENDKKSAFFLTFWSSTSYKISEKSEKVSHTHIQTDVTPKVWTTRWSRPKVKN